MSMTARERLAPDDRDRSELAMESIMKKLGMAVSVVALALAASVSMAILDLRAVPWSCTYFATQRMPFPHMRPRLPSALYISMRQSAVLDG